MMEQVRLGDVWPMENWLGSSLNQIQGWTTVRELYSSALEQGPLVGDICESDKQASRRRRRSAFSPDSERRSDNEKTSKTF